MFTAAVVIAFYLSYCLPLSAWVRFFLFYLFGVDADV